MYVSKHALNNFLVHSRAKGCLRSAKNVIFLLLCILFVAPPPSGSATVLYPDSFCICLSQMPEQKIPSHINMNLEKGLKFLRLIYTILDIRLPNYELKI